jgi:apolipoprotein D and lipocalin family protein
VIAVKPTMFEKTCSNAVEIYTQTTTQPGKGHDIDIDFKYNNHEPIKSALKSLPQKGYVEGDDKSNSARWKVSPFWPIKMPYLILEIDDAGRDYTVIGYPSREYCWIMSRTPQMEEQTYDRLTKLLVEKHQYEADPETKVAGLRKVPQFWTAEERAKRGLVDAIPDQMLSQ